MTGSRLVLPLFLVIAVVGAGCVTEGTKNDTLPPAATVDEASGAIEGVVLSDELVPIPGAQVGLGTDRTTEASTSGAFTFSQVPPGRHVLSAIGLGYESRSLAVEVAAGEVTSVVLQLAEIPSEVPYYEVFPQSGLLGCSVQSEQLPTGVDGFLMCETFWIAGLEDIDEMLLLYSVGALDSIVGFWGETVWTSSQALGTQMSVGWGVPGDGSTPETNFVWWAPFVTAEGGSPIRIRIPIDLLEDAIGEGMEFCDDEDCMMFSVHMAGDDAINAGAASGSVMLQQRFDEYLTVFHHGELPEDFQVTPDG